MAIKLLHPSVLYCSSIVGCTSFGTIYGGYYQARSHNSSFVDVCMGTAFGLWAGFSVGLLSPMLVPVSIISVPMYVIYKKSENPEKPTSLK